MCSDTLKADLVAINPQFADLLSVKKWVQRGKKARHNRLSGARIGIHQSKKRGQGMSFEEVRAYSPQDDLRLVDWKVTARTGQPYTKIFCEEVEQPLFLVVNFSNTMKFGTKNVFKQVVAARCASLLAWSTIGNDLVKMLRFDDNGLEIIKSSHNKTHLTKALSNLCTPFTYSHQFNQANNLTADTLQFIGKMTSKNGQLKLITDLYDWNISLEKILNLLSKKYDVSIIWVTDPVERCLPVENNSFFTDMSESILSNQQLNNQYKKTFLDKKQYILTFCLKNNISLIHVGTENDFPTLIQKLKIK